MEEKIHKYENKEIRITYDLKRCIHAAECVKGLRAVFDPDKRPWIRPDNANAERISEVATRCPTGALHFERLDGGPGEKKPERNSISITPDGPVYIRGDIEIRDHGDTVLLKDTRFALCRCGKSNNKPACDNSHAESGFEAPSYFDESHIEGSETDGHSQSQPLILKIMKDGPVLVEGAYQIYSHSSPPAHSRKTIALCRCGGSSNKPFCDGTHKKIGFKS